MKKTFKLLLAGCLLTAGFAFANGDNYSSVEKNNVIYSDTIPPQDDVDPDTSEPVQDTVSVPQDTTTAPPVEESPME